MFADGHRLRAARRIELLAETQGGPGMLLDVPELTHQSVFEIMLRCSHFEIILICPGHIAVLGSVNVELDHVLGWACDISESLDFVLVPPQELIKMTWGGVRPVRMYSKGGALIHLAGHRYDLDLQVDHYDEEYQKAERY